MYDVPEQGFVEVSHHFDPDILMHLNEYEICTIESFNLNLKFP